MGFYHDALDYSISRVRVNLAYALVWVSCAVHAGILYGVVAT